MILLFHKEINYDVPITNNESKTINFTSQYEQIQFKNLSIKSNYKATIEKNEPITIKITGEKRINRKIYHCLIRFI